LPTWLNGRAA